MSAPLSRVPLMQRTADVVRRRRPPPLTTPERINCNVRTLFLSARDASLRGRVMRSAVFVCGRLDGARLAIAGDCFPAIVVVPPRVGTRVTVFGTRAAVGSTERKRRPGGNHSTPMRSHGSSRHSRLG